MNPLTFFSKPNRAARKARRAERRRRIAAGTRAINADESELHDQ